MSDILKQIQALQEQFSNLFEAEKEDLKTYQNKAAKDIMDKLGLDIKGYIKRITPVRDYKELEQHKQRKVKEFAADQLSPYDKVKGIKLTDREHSLDKHKGTIEAHRKEIQDTAKEYKTGDDSVAKSIIKGKKKMNDNNSYNEIVSQIMDLKEAFSNLFEVEGLGEPSSEVPPSTNKLKKDIKTKNGKVELVSVENELFPYDGNKKEQFQQKVLDTINGMIQGTATLEDLLQIVRQKKAPLKEAMEVLEELIAEKESYVFPKKAVADGNAKYEKAYKDKVKATRLARKGFEKLNKKVKELEKKGIDTDIDIHPDITYVNGPKHEYQQALKTASDLHDKQRETDRAETEAGHNQRKLRLAGLKGVTMGEFEPVPTKKGDNFKFKKVLTKNEALEEALEKANRLIEGLFVNDGRGDLLDDISKALTNRTLKDHVVSTVKNIAVPKKEVKKKVKECKK